MQRSLASARKQALNNADARRDADTPTSCAADRFESSAKSAANTAAHAMGYGSRQLVGRTYRALKRRNNANGGTERSRSSGFSQAPADRRECERTTPRPGQALQTSAHTRYSAEPQREINVSRVKNTAQRMRANRLKTMHQSIKNADILNAVPAPIPAAQRSVSRANMVKGTLRDKPLKAILPQGVQAAASSPKGQKTTANAARIANEKRLNNDFVNPSLHIFHKFFV